MSTKSKAAGTETSEWVCKKHGFQIPPAKGAKEPKCKWCGTPLQHQTWTMSGGR
jgi:hypothetical protein